MRSLLAKAACVDVGIQWGLFVVAAVLKTEKFYDLAGSGTFLYLAYQTLQWNGTHFLRQTVQSRLIMLWALRLGLYLFTRVLKDGKDRRFDKVRNNPKTFFVFWTVQAVWVFITLLPSLILNSKKTDRPLTSRDYVGWTMWAIGFTMETIADYQKSRFRNNPANKGQFIQHGLWSLSRHPNYFGEMMLWFGLYVSASSTMKDWEYVSVLSPVFVTLLISKVSGIPMLERSAMKKWGQNTEYLKYVKDTPLLVPFLRF